MKKLYHLTFSLAVFFLPFFVSAHVGDDDSLHHMDGFSMGSGMVYGSGFFSVFGWITFILVWIFLILGSAAFWKYLNEGKRK